MFRGRYWRFCHGMTFAVSAKILSTPIMHLIHLPRRMIKQCTCYCLSGSLCRDPALGVFLALGAQVIFFAPVAGQFLILGAPDAFFAPVVLGISGVYVQCGLILHIFSRN